MADISQTIVVAGNYRCGTTWLAEMLCRGLGYELAFEPIRSYFPIVANAGITQWRPYLTAETATPKQRELFRMMLDGTICKHAELHHTNCKKVLAVDKVLVKFVRATMSLRWLCEMFPLRHVFLIMRHPFTAVASQVRKHAAQGTPMKLAELEAFQRAHPEIDLEAVPRKTDVQWLALWWAASYYAALSSPEPHPWSLVHYEDLCADERNREQLFEAVGEQPRPYQPRKLSIMAGPWSTGKPTRWQGALTVAQTQQIEEVVERFPLLIERYPRWQSGR